MKSGILLLASFAMVSVVSASPCRDAVWATHGAGPEITGDYARCYLYSSSTGRWYADPLYYVAEDALCDWRARRLRDSARTSLMKSARKRSEPTVEK